MGKDLYIYILIYHCVFCSLYWLLHKLYTCILLPNPRTHKFLSSVSYDRLDNSTTTQIQKKKQQ